MLTHTIILFFASWSPSSLEMKARLEADPTIRVVAYDVDDYRVAMRAEQLGVRSVPTVVEGK